MSEVLVTDAQLRNSLAIIRSLGKKGLDVTGAEETRFATSFFSKYCKHSLVYPPPEKSQEPFLKFLLDTVKRKDYEVIFPVSDSTVMPISKHREKFSKHTIVPLADYSTLMKARDKAQTIQIANDINIDCPKTYTVEGLDELDKIKTEIEYPAIIKPRESCGSRGLALCKTKKELVSQYKQISSAYGPCLIQEYIPPGGDEIGVYTLFNFDSKPRAVCTQRRIRSYPVSGGPSTLRESIKDPDLEKKAIKLLRALDWFGVAMVEFKIDPRDNRPKLMEVNPRFWGSLQLSILSGVDFPYLLYKMVTEGDVEPVSTYKTGVRCRWLLPGDILYFLSAPNKIKNLPEFLRFYDKDLGYDILSSEDPGPTFGFTLATLRYLFDKNMWRYIIRRSI